jgi:pyruvate/2-oxoglutarate dehydrogenase complex dihydrolipoamide dehydrogenase (E3) component
MNRPEFDLCIIGGGAAGLVVAAGGASLGAKVALVEKGKMGGDCLHYGCVPSKALLQSARVAHTLRSAGRFALPPHEPEINLATVMERVAGIIKGIEPHDSPERFRGLGVEVIEGAGEFLDHRSFAVNGRTITSKHFVIATGSRAAVPAIPGLERVPYLTNETLFDLREPVAELIVIGGGPIGVEMAQAFTRLGSRVTLVQRGAQLLPAEDPDLVAIVADQLQQDGVTLFCGHAPLRVEGGAGDIRLISKENSGSETTLNATHLLLATGRRPNTGTLGLAAAGVELDNGRIVTDARLRTSNKRIFAAGDVTGGPMFTHVAEHHAGVVLRNALFRLPARIERKVVPWATFTDPELARVGLSENQAREQGIDHRVYTFPFADLDRARTDGETEGLAKIITDPKGKLLGAAIVGPHAGELIHEYVLAIAKGMKAADLSAVIHIYPTLAQINRRVADARLKEGLTPSAKRWMKRIFGLRGPNNPG